MKTEATPGNVRLNDGLGLVERLRAGCTDWNGDQMDDGAPPMDCLKAGDAREAADEIERLRADLASMHAAREMTDMALDAADNEIERLLSLVNRAVAGYAADDASVPTCVSILREALGPNARANARPQAVALSEVLGPNANRQGRLDR